jgi:hypothetical protein
MYDVECTFVQVNFEFRTFAFSTTLPRWHDMRKIIFWTFTLPNNVNSSMARSKVTYIETVVME